MGAAGQGLGDRGVGRTIGNRVFFPESGLVIGGGISLHPYSDEFLANYSPLLEGSHPYDLYSRRDLTGGTSGGSAFLSPWQYVQSLPESITIPKVGIVNGGSMHLSPYTPPPPPSPPPPSPPPPSITGGFSPLLIGTLASAVFSLAKKVLGGSLNTSERASLAPDGTMEHPVMVVFRHRNGSINIKPIDTHTA